MASQPPAQPPVQYNLLIEFIFEHKRRWGMRPFKKRRFPLQYVPFRFGVRVTNIGVNVFPGALIKEFRMDYAEVPHETHYTAEGQFGIPALNPEESKEIWMGTTSTYYHGLVFMVCELEKAQPNHEIRTFQNGESRPEFFAADRWADHDYIQSYSELQQARTNMLLLLLAAIALVHGVFGLDRVAIGLARLLGHLFLWFGGLFPE